MNTGQSAILGDRALDAVEDDKLGFGDVATQISISLMDRASSTGLVVGLEGAWGSGKSSLLFLVHRELATQPPEREPSVITFRPWLIGNRDALVSSLFGELLKELHRVTAIKGASPLLTNKASKAVEALRGFMSGLSKAGATIEVAGEASGFGPIKILGSLLKSSASMWLGKSVLPSLAELKAKLVAALRELDRRFVVMIDDVDRLEPSEAMEVLRLVRSVVDLPNVVYLLCYDRDVLAHSVEQATGVMNGHAYLEKIIQLTVMVPKPQPFELRQWFTDELGEIASPKDDEERRRLQTVVDIEGGRHLATPRSVVRALDAMRFFWPPLRETAADLADLVWLHLIKEGKPALYRWIEDYCAGAAVISLGTARMDEKGKRGEVAALLAAVPDDYFESDSYRHHFSEQLPGIEPVYADKGNVFELFCHVPDHKRQAAIRHKRLSSPDHYRFYFAMSGPSHALVHDDFELFRQAAAISPDTVEQVLLTLQVEKASGSLTKADMMLERMKDGAHELLDEQQCVNVLIGFSNVMDKAYRERNFERGWLKTIWDRAERLTKVLCARLSNERRNETLTSMFVQGQAIGWLTGLVRHERVSQGRVGDAQRSKSEWLLSADELDRTTLAIVERYRKMSSGEVFAVPNPITLLFMWLEVDDGDRPRRVIQENTETDEGLLTTLESLATTITTSTQESFKVLKDETLSSFLDYRDARRRVEGLKNNPALGGRAVFLAEAFRVGESY